MKKSHPGNISLGGTPGYRWSAQRLTSKKHITARRLALLAQKKMRFANWTDAEIQRWLQLRAIEWCGFPAFASQPLVPIAFLLFSWYWVIATVVVLNILWSGIRYSYINITAATVACLFVRLAMWPSAIGSTIYLFIHRQFVPGLIALFWPFLAGYIPPSGKIGVIELAFAKKIGYVPDDTEL